MRDNYCNNCERLLASVEVLRAKLMGTEVKLGELKIALSQSNAKLAEMTAKYEKTYDSYERHHAAMVYNFDQWEKAKAQLTQLQAERDGFEKKLKAAEYKLTCYSLDGPLATEIDERNSALRQNFELVEWCDRLAGCLEQAIEASKIKRGGDFVYGAPNWLKVKSGWESFKRARGNK